MFVSLWTAGLETFLRGMETREEKTMSVEVQDLETFLRGMETGGTVKIFSPLITSLKPSLEGWKQLATRRGELVYVFLETFLRGMETPMCISSGRAPASSLKPSLEGWKLPIPDVELPQPGALKPSLEGWKPG